MEVPIVVEARPLDQRIRRPVHESTVRTERRRFRLAARDGSP
jgi:hypothetical protein